MKLFYGFLFSFLWAGTAAVAQSPTITNLASPASFCAGGSLVVNFSASGYDSSNQFIAQLSNSTGSFASPVTIGTVTGASGGTITGTIATNQMMGSGYRVRVIATSPSSIGANNGVNLTINPRPSSSQLTITPSSQTVCPGGSATFTIVSNPGFSYQWLLGGTPINGATNVSHTATVFGIYSVNVTNTFGCSTTSSTRMLIAATVPVSSTVPNTTQNFTGSPILFKNNNMSTGLLYQWLLNGSPISGATTNQYNATGVGNYSLILKNSMGCSDTSDEVLVKLPQQATISPSTSQTICTGQSLLFSANTGSGLTYQWLKTGVAIPGATNSTYSANSTGTYSVTVTGPNGSATTPGVMVYVVMAPSTVVSPASTQVICPGQSVNFTSAATAGTGIQWLLNGSPITNATNNSYVATVAGDYSVMVSNTGCTLTSGSTSVVNNQNCINAPAITALNPATAFCAGSQVTIQFSASGFDSGNVFTAQISNTAGSFSAPFTLGTLSGGSGGVITATIPTSLMIGGGYRIRVVSSSPALTGADNGTNLTINPRPSTSQMSITPASQRVCPGGSATFTIVSNPGFTYQWLFNGNAIANATNVSYTGSALGIYSVNVTNNFGCSNISSTRMITAATVPVSSVTPNTTQYYTGTPISLTNNNMDAGLTYQWLESNNPIVGATTNQYVTSLPGSYSLVLGNSMGCFDTSMAVSVVVPQTAVSITDFGSVSKCVGDTISVSFNAVNFAIGNVFNLELSDNLGSFSNATVIGSSAVTSSGSMTGTIPSTMSSGNGYKLRITSSSPATVGTAASSSLSIRTSIIDSVKLCGVTVDAISGKNKLVWNKPLGMNIDSFIVYRSNNANSFDRLAAQPNVGTLSIFIDSSSAPSVYAHKYYISGKNRCGETINMGQHKTIHLTINAGQNSNTWNLIWNGYEGFNHNTYQIWRGSSVNNMSLIFQLGADSYNSYTDFDAPTGNVFYQVRIADAPVCSPSARTTGGEEPWIGSNIATNAKESVVSGWANMNVFPNPSKGGTQVMIESSQTGEPYLLRVYDVTGRVLIEKDAMPGKEVMVGEELATGVYVIEAIGDHTRMQRKWVKQ